MTLYRVGFFTEIYRPAVNGVVTAVDTLADGLRGRGHTVKCYAPSMPGSDEFDDPVVRMPSLPLPARAPYRLTLPLVSRRTRTLIKGLSLVHLHSPFVTGWMGLRYARRYGMPAVFTYHTHLEAYAHYVPFDVNATRFAASQLTRTFCNLVDAVIVPTEAMAQHLRDLGVNVRIDVIPSGIDVASFARGARDDRLRRHLGARDGTRLLLTVSRLAAEKNIDVLLQALAQCPGDDVRLVIAGDGPDRDELQRRARELRVSERCVFLGIVGRERLPALYASCDAFVFASTSETQGLVQVEAMAAGLPPIVADCPPNRDVAASEGTVVAPTAQAFAAAMRAVPCDVDARRAAALKRSSDRFSVDRQLDRTLLLYGDLVGMPASHSA